jgi:hypothetical protein
MEELTSEEIKTSGIVGSPIRKTARTLPTRSTTAMVALTPRAFASPTAWAMMVCTSETERDTPAVKQLPLQSVLSKPRPTD